MSDGRRTTAPIRSTPPGWRRTAGLRVFTVGFGTAAGAMIGFEGWSAYVRLDEETLKAVADVTRGEYFYAGTAADLTKVYQASIRGWSSSGRTWRSRRCSPRPRRFSSSCR